MLIFVNGKRILLSISLFLIWQQQLEGKWLSRVIIPLRRLIYFSGSVTHKKNISTFIPSCTHFSRILKWLDMNIIQEVPKLPLFFLINLILLRYILTLWSILIKLKEFIEDLLLIIGRIDSKLL